MSKLFTLDLRDIGKGLVMAILGGLALPILAAIQTPGFDVFQANWQAIGILAINGAVAAMASYLLKNLFSDAEGKFMGKI